MAFNPPTAVCDACVLYPFHQRNILIQVSADGLYDARWTEEIHDENFHHHIEAINLPDPDDRHVVAAAIEAKASHILTWNLRDFSRKGSGSCVRTLQHYSRSQEVFTFRAQMLQPSSNVALLAK